MKLYTTPYVFSAVVNAAQDVFGRLNGAGLPGSFLSRRPPFQTVQSAEPPPDPQTSSRVIGGLTSHIPAPRRLPELRLLRFRTSWAAVERSRPSPAGWTAQLSPCLRLSWCLRVRQHAPPLIITHHSGYCISNVSFWMTKLAVRHDALGPVNTYGSCTPRLSYCS